MMSNRLTFLSMFTTHIEQLVEGGIKVGNVLVGHPVHAVDPEFTDANSAVT